MANLSDLTAQCIRCGFCLESCPTFQITSDESQSPRGRITLTKDALENGWNTDSQQAIDSCLGCLSCETACPSGVRFGEILELARSQSNKMDSKQHKVRKLFLNSLTHPLVSNLQFRIAPLVSNQPPNWLSKLLSSQDPVATIPRIEDDDCFAPLDEAILPPISGEVYLLEGCVMRTLYPDVHRATRRLLRRVGLQTIDSGTGCCGALHAHAGYREEAESHAQKLAKRFPKEIPIIVNSAGCGSTMKRYGEVVGIGLEGVGVRTRDLIQILIDKALQKSYPFTFPPTKVAFHDACHLIHGQKLSLASTPLITEAPNITALSIPDAHLCCGSAGTYNLFQPNLALQARHRKWKSICSTNPDVVVTGNPGCYAWLKQAAEEDGSSIKILQTPLFLESLFDPNLLA